MGLITACLDVLQSLKYRSLSEEVVLGVAQTQSEVVHVLQDLFQGQLSQFTARTAQTLSLAGLVVVLDQLGLYVFCQCVVVFGSPVSQDASGELVFWVTGTTQDHFHHLFAGLFSAKLQQQAGQGLRVLFVFEVLQDGDDGFQGNAVGQKQLPGAILLEGLPLE